MREFRANQRVKVTDPGLVLHGKTGRVVRLRIGDDCAWVRMDDPIPDDITSFPAGDARHNDVLLVPCECSPAGSVPSVSSVVDPSGGAA